MIIGMTGSIAAGKETLTDSLIKKGFIYFETSKLLKEELKRRGNEITRSNMQDLGDELREKHGPGAFMKMLLEKTEPGKDYIFDSLRNAGEVEFLRNNAEKFILIAVDAPKRIRFQRILARGKPSDPKTWEEFSKVDDRDFFDQNNPLGQQISKCMELADIKLINDSTLEEFQKKIKEVMDNMQKS
jgi:dephospho-CoA kinase